MPAHPPLEPGSVLAVPDLTPSAAAWLGLSLAAGGRTVVWVAEDDPRRETIDQDARTLLALRSGVEILAFPQWETFPSPDQPLNPERAGQRMQALDRLARPAPAGGRLVITSIQAALQRLRAPQQAAAASRVLTVGESVDLENLLAWLEREGYVFDAEVLERGQASLRGGLLDVWPPTEPRPLRLEFFGPELESARTFDPEDQRSRDRLDVVSLPPVVEADESNRTATLGDFLPPGSVWVWDRPEEIEAHAEAYLAGAAEAGARDRLWTFRDLREKLQDASPVAPPAKGGDRPAMRESTPQDPRPPRTGLPKGSRVPVAPPAKGGDAGPCVLVCGARDGSSPTWDPGLLEGDSLGAAPTDGAALEKLEARRKAWVEALRAEARRPGRAVSLWFHTDGARDRFREMYLGGKASRGLQLEVGPLSGGFVQSDPPQRVACETDLYGRKPVRRPVRKRSRPEPDKGGARIAHWSELIPGDYVVHIRHGVGRYLGLYEIEVAGVKQEALALEYANDAKLYLEVSQAHLLSRYVGVGEGRPALHQLGGTRWRNEKAKAEGAVRDLAAQLLETQAARDVLEGFSTGPDTPWQHEFEAAFPYTETPDQETALAEVKHDMESTRPMDRLICGDAGYGKTEVAIRAAFKAVMAGKQVAMLVPTTVLAQQHLDTFAARMAAFPVRVEMLSRFRTDAQQRKVVEALAAGEVDIVIGTHRLVQPDLKFKDLGLVIIDEEQRFGVAHKETLKQFRRLCDVLTMSATPIPRTLYMSLTGARDMSVIQTPPRLRQPIQTLVATDRDEVLRAAIHRELNRGGQVFFLHNRVATISAVADRLAELVPEARIRTAHGQMHERELAAIMRSFSRGEFEILVCTTIVESGIDIPNVNTIFIDRADRFGLSDLYQLRGRVGRDRHQAYAYLLVPARGSLPGDARRRIQALTQHSSLGAGFRIAMRDLEIRGAGNLLGAEQSGHIAAIGFELYCQLLRRTVARLKHEDIPPIVEVEMKLDFLSLAPETEDRPDAAMIPTGYLEDERLRVQAYRAVAGAARDEDITALREDFADRFGPLPRALENLLAVAGLRILAARARIDTVEVREDKVMLLRHGDYLQADGRFPRLPDAPAPARLDALRAILETAAPRPWLRPPPVRAKRSEA